MRRKSILSFLIMYGAIICVLILAALAGSKAVTVYTETAPLAQRMTVIIDAGHGGVDGGAISCTGVLESQINLEIALRLDDLMHLLGIQTKMIRNTDVSIHTKGESIAYKKVSDLKQRVQIVNNEEKALLISLHQNYFSDNRYSGAQVFYAQTTGSDTYANALQYAFAQTLNKGSKRQSKKAKGIYLMEHITAPGALIECGFLSNPAEESLLRSSEYQKKLCCVIAAVTTSHISKMLSA